MLSFALVLGFLGAVICDPINQNGYERVNHLIDSVILEKLHNKDGIKVAFPQIEDIVVKALPTLKREGNCELTKDNIYSCKVISDQVKATFDGQLHECTLRFHMEVTVEGLGQLKSWQINETDIIFADNTTDDEYYGWIKKHLHHLKHAITKVVKEAVHVVIEKKVKEIVTSIALSLIK